MKLKDGIVRPDLSLATAVEHDQEKNVLRFIFDKPNMIIIVPLPKDGLRGIDLGDDAALATR